MSPSHEIRIYRRTCFFCKLQKYGFRGLLVGTIQESAQSVGLIPTARRLLLCGPRPHL